MTNIQICRVCFSNSVLVKILAIKEFIDPVHMARNLLSPIGIGSIFHVKATGFISDCSSIRIATKRINIIYI